MTKKNFLSKVRKIKKKIDLINNLGGSCLLCGEKNFIKLCFHHIDSDDKDFALSANTHMFFDELYTEAKKCQVLCQNCHREIHYNNNLKTDNRRKDKVIYLEYAGSKCIECGYDKCPSSLTFHHREPHLKEFWIGCLSERIQTIEDISNSIKNELDKCDVLCSNCHVERHFDIEFYLKNKELIHNYKIKKISRKIDRNVVFELYSKGYTQKYISSFLNCGKSTISDIIRGR